MNKDVTKCYSVSLYLYTVHSSSIQNNCWLQIFLFNSYCFNSSKKYCQVVWYRINRVKSSLYKLYGFFIIFHYKMYKTYQSAGVLWNSINFFIHLLLLLILFLNAEIWCDSRFLNVFPEELISNARKVNIYFVYFNHFSKL